MKLSNNKDGVIIKREGQHLQFTYAEANEIREFLVGLFETGEEPTMTTEPNDEMEKALKEWRSLPETARHYAEIRDGQYGPLNCMEYGFRAGWAARDALGVKTEITDDEGNVRSTIWSKPITPNLQTTEEYNAWAKDVAKRNGWTWTGPMAGAEPDKQRENTERLNALRSILSLFNDMAATSNDPNFIKTRSEIVLAIADLVGGGK